VSRTGGRGSLGRREQAGDAGAGDEPATLQARLEQEPDTGAGAAGTALVPADQTIADPVALLRHLDVSGQFHRDSRVGRMYHPGMVSLREDVPTDSLHVSVDDNRVMAHVDEVSPLAANAAGESRYSVTRAVSHNLSGMARDLMLLLRGRQGDHRSELNCEWVSGEAAANAADKVPLLDPKTTAWSVQLEARVAGSLDEGRLRAAFDAVVGRRTPQRDYLEVVDCEDDDDLQAARSRLHRMGVPLTTFPPLHAYLARHPAGDVLMLNLNHAATDGFGAVRVLHRIASAYAGRAEPRVALDFLACHDIPVRPAPAVQSTVVRSCESATARLRDLLAPHVPLAGDEPADDPGYGFLFVGLTPEQTHFVEGVERTDTDGMILLTALHLAIGDWNRRHAMADRRIGVLVPVNLRPDEWREDTIANFSVTTRLSTSRRERASAAAARKAITTRAARNKRTRTGIALVAGLDRAGMLGLWAKQSRVVLEPLTDHSRVDAAMLCDLERLHEAPSFGPDAGDIVELWFSTPARSPRILSIGAVSVGGRLHLTFRYPHRLFGPDAARRFVDCYLAHVWKVADSR
jgi:hypothetical protein